MNEDLSKLTARLDHLESRMALNDLVSDYCLGFDKREWQRFIGIWWEDCVWEIGPPFGDFDGHTGIEAAVKDILWPAWDKSTHYTANLSVDFHGPNLADGVCDVYCIGNLSDGGAHTVAATYNDRFERRDGVWRIKLRTVTMHHFSPLIGITLAPPA